MRKKIETNSTLEITNIAKTLNPGSKINPIERHGEEPVMTNCSSFADEMKQFKHMIGKIISSNGTNIVYCNCQ